MAEYTVLKPLLHAGTAYAAGATIDVDGDDAVQLLLANRVAPVAVPTGSFQGSLPYGPTLPSPTSAGAPILFFCTAAETCGLYILFEGAYQPFLTDVGPADLDISAFMRTVLDDVDATTARATLGLTIGTNVQAYHAKLAALAGLTWAANSFPVFSGTNTAEVAQLTEFTLGFLTDVDAAAARTRLGLTPGTHVQAYSAKLAALVGLTWAADKLAYITGDGTAATADFSPFARTLVDDVDASAARSTLNLVIGTHVQAYSAKLAALVGLTWAANKLAYITGDGTAATTDFSAFARTLLDDADATAARETLGVNAAVTGLTTAIRERASARPVLPNPIGDFRGSGIASASGLLTSWDNYAPGQTWDFTPEVGKAAKVGVDSAGRAYITAPDGGGAHHATSATPAQLVERTYLLAYEGDYLAGQEQIFKHSADGTLYGLSFITYNGQLDFQFYGTGSANEGHPLTGGIEIYAVSVKAAERIHHSTVDDPIRRYVTGTVALNEGHATNVGIGWPSAGFFTGKLYALQIWDRALSAEQLAVATQDMADHLGIHRPERRVRWGREANAAWSARDSAGVAVMGDELYVIAGYTNGGLYNDVWKRAAGGAWSQVNASAAFSVRNLIGAAVHAGKLWISNGFTTGLSPLKEIWSSSDGNTWANDVPSGSAAWTARAASKMVSHNGELIFCGGFSNTTGGALNDVWASSDGVSWTQRAASAAWSARGSHAFLSFAGKLWVIAGGVYNTGNPNNTQIDYNDVYASSDNGATWQLQGSLPVPPMRFVSCAVHSGRMWLVGGFHHQNKALVLSSDNGLTWDIIPTKWTRRHEPLVASFDNKLYVMGGVLGASNATMRASYNEPWVSDLGVANDVHWLGSIAP